MCEFESKKDKKIAGECIFCFTRVLASKKSNTIFAVENNSQRKKLFGYGVKCCKGRRSGDLT